MLPCYYTPYHQGLELNRPEIVPFRLTPNMVDAMGLTGIEGTYRRSAEVCMGLLRDNRYQITQPTTQSPFLKRVPVSALPFV